LQLEGQLEQLKLAAQQQQVVEQSRAARAASKVADLQQQVQVLETALYAKEEVSVGRQPGW
jgi:hypothetical protein